MATIYKIEIEVVSHWVSYSEETMRNAIQKQLDSIMKAEKVNKPSNELDAEIVICKNVTKGY